jgi:hypothetical protein
MAEQQHREVGARGWDPAERTSGALVMISITAVMINDRQRRRRRRRRPMPDIDRLEMKTRVDEILTRHPALGLALGAVRNGSVEFFQVAFGDDPVHLVTLDHDQRSDAFGGQPPGHLTHGRLRPDPDQPPQRQTAAPGQSPYRFAFLSGGPAAIGATS